MDRWSGILAIIVAFFCAIFSIFAVFGGDMTSAPESGFEKIDKGENLNDVHSIMQSIKGDIYTLGYTCVQKFSESGNFVSGAYFDSNNIKQIKNYQFLSLNDGNVVVLNIRDNTIYIFNDSFDVIDKIEVIESYDENKFYLDYPNTDVLDNDIRLSFFDNTVLSENAKIKLDAPRNRLFSRDVGMLILFASIIVILVCSKRRE